MQCYLQKFDELYKGKTYIEIEFISDEPFSAKYSRSNQSGQVCYCMFGTDQANQKTKDGWQKVECLGQECQYRQKKENGPSDCKKIGWLKFLIPKIATDRIWLMKTTSTQAIDSLNEYFSLQKSQGNSVKGRYILFLKQIENSKDGKTFNNFIVDIMKKEDFNSIAKTPQNEENEQEQSTANVQTVNNSVENTPKQENKKSLEKSKETENKLKKEKLKKQQTLQLKKTLILISATILRDITQKLLIKTENQKNILLVSFLI